MPIKLNKNLWSPQSVFKQLPTLYISPNADEVFLQYSNTPGKEFCAIITSTSVNVVILHVTSQVLAISIHLLLTHVFDSLCMRNSHLR